MFQWKLRSWIVQKWINESVFEIFFTRSGKILIFKKIGWKNPSKVNIHWIFEQFQLSTSRLLLPCSYSDAYQKYVKPSRTYGRLRFKWDFKFRKNTQKSSILGNILLMAASNDLFWVRKGFIYWKHDIFALGIPLPNRF